MIARIATTTLALVLVGCDGAGQHCADGKGDALTTCYESGGSVGLGPVGGLGTSVLMTTLCAAVGQNPAPGPCPDEGKVGGCLTEQDDDGFFATKWSYTGALDDLTCDGDEVLVDADGEPVEIEDLGTPSACSGESTQAVTVTIANDRDGAVSLFWVDAACQEQPYATVEPGGTHVQPTYATHVWVARTGIGRLVWEHLVTPGDEGRTFAVE